MKTPTGQWFSPVSSTNETDCHNTTEILLKVPLNIISLTIKQGALDLQPQVIKFTSCLPMVGGSLRVLRLPPPLKLVAMI
jgi:hypothetical protein